MLQGRRLDVEQNAIPSEDPDTPEELASAEGHLAEPQLEAEKVTLEYEPEKPLSPTKRYEAERRTARIARWQRVQELHRAGVSIRRIGEEVGITR